MYCLRVAKMSHTKWQFSLFFSVVCVATVIAAVSFIKFHFVLLVRRAFPFAMKFFYTMDFKTTANDKKNRQAYNNNDNDDEKESDSYIV